MGERRRGRYAQERRIPLSANEVKRLAQIQAARVVHPQGSIGVSGELMMADLQIGDLTLSSLTLQDEAQLIARAVEQQRADPEVAAQGYSYQVIKANRGPTYQFMGKLLGEHSTNPKGDRTKWTELRLWETPSGKWVAESAGCSDEPGHVDIADAHVIRGPVVLIDRQILKDFEEKTTQTLSMEFQAMEFWGWSSPAKALANKLGWNLIIKID